MKTIKERNEISRYISYLLRHKPEKEGLELDKNGYVSVFLLCKKLDICKEDLDWIVDTNDKKRFAYNDDETLIRASQGHSKKVDLNLTPINPPHKLYHGTALKNLESIKKNGLVKMNRQHVHLTAAKITAEDVGKRHVKDGDQLLLLSIEAKLMNFYGYKFFLSENGVYLTDHVPIDYIKVIS